MMPLLEVVYESQCAQVLAADTIAGIRAVSAARNKAQGISGLLILHGTSFVGVLEGPPDAVIETLERISNDPRNRRLVILREAPIETRRFADWRFYDPGGAQASDAQPGDWQWFALKLSRDLRRNRPPQNAA